MSDKIVNALRRAKRTVKSAISSPLPVLSAEQRAFWDANGYLVLPSHFTSDRVAEVTREVERFWSLSREQNLDTVVDVYIGTSKEKRIRLRNAPNDARLYPFKLNDLFLESELVRSIILEEKLASILWHLLSGPPMCCNSLNFEFGSQQPYHTDSLYMTPPRDLNLVATWIALEDCHPDAGPLRYLPGSHLIPPFRFSNGSIHFIESEMQAYSEYMDRQVAKLGLKEETFCAKAGDVFIWHSQLFHSGSKINDPKRTRRSLVSHYFRWQDSDASATQVNAYGYYMRRSPQTVKD